MAKYFCVRIRPDSFQCSTIEYQNSQIRLLESKEFFSIVELQSFIQNRTNINYVLYDNQVLKSSFFISRNVKGRSSINSTIYTKLQKDHKDIQKIRFKYSISEDNPKKENIKYAVHGIYQNTPTYKKLEQLTTNQNANLVTLENYSLYSLSKKMLPKNLNFISIWADKKSLTLIAGNNSELFYSRNESLINSTQALSQEISKNVMFVIQRVREVKFDTLIINGSLYANESLFSELQKQTKLNVTTFYPTSELFSEISYDHFHDQLLSLGSLFIKYELDFISSKIKAYNQYNKALKYLTVLLIAIFGFTTFDAYEKYSNYQDSATKYSSTFQRLNNIKEDLGLQSIEHRQTLYSIFDILKEKNSFDFIEQVQVIKNSLEFTNRSSKQINLQLDLEKLQWKKAEVLVLKFTQVFRFVDLAQLNSLKNDIERIEKKLKTKVLIEQNIDLERLSGSIIFNFYGEYDAK